jgi:N-acetylmuramoyl-L-alanine amidase
VWTAARRMGIVRSGTGVGMRVFLAAVAALWLGFGGAAAQELSALARLDPAASSLRDDGRGIEVALALSQPVPWRVRVLDMPPRLILDVREVDWTGIGAVARDSRRVTDLRAGVFRQGWSRLVLELSSPFLVDEAEMRTGDGAARLVLRMQPASAAAFAAKAAQPEPEDWAAPQAGDGPADRGAGPRPWRH